MKTVDLHPRVVLGVAAHPDDLDFGAGGTMAHFARQGADVYYLILTDGGSGTTDREMTQQKLTQLRQDEQRQACQALGLKDVFFCTYQDGCLENTKEVRKDIVKMIRKLRPDVVITWDPSMLYSAVHKMINHPDHRAAGQATLDAVYPLARDHLAFPELIKQGYEPHKTGVVLLMNFHDTNYAVDISDCLEAKMQAIAAHTTQVSDIESVRKRLTLVAEEEGKAHHMHYAETFMRIDIE